ncbi:glycoside hydrolase family 16 protein [Dothidotthia symphoricarpi CBS 119687]|uniref:chitinase n=1 Tax=Dothidotthia symphoricarpi CBS 119687 TaxID=1392245 RepID=A0A6A6AUX9_9PLEO|nr:glycoside hydrolase family 16 protein [Dothidotthia symphoricarpi CBS 119687]KAF2135013.1 glycoside hydrolase family 16 protein [Dothidotthia symphoricarpi CBS 119687]
MLSAVRAVAALASAALLVAPSAAQTYTNCNPTLRSDCPADSALGRTVNIDFTSSSDSFTPQGNPTYDSSGAAFTISKTGDAPTLTSKWYIMFGKVEVSMKAAPGAGIVSSFVLQSDTLDEIDWEWLGADPDEVQSNYFGKGQTTSYNRGAFHADTGSQTTYKMYTIEWTPEQIVWQIDGKTVRTLEPANAENQYPQSPMQIKLGAWSGGDSANPAGTISWARGPTDYSKGPYTMHVMSLKVSDYSTGTQYSYGDTSGTWGSIKSNGGVIYSGGDKPIQDSPQVTATASGQPIPFTPHTTSVVDRPSVYPWVPASSSYVPQPTFANYPGLPSGWSVSDTGKVVPPSSAPPSPRVSSMLSPAALLSAPSGDSRPEEIISIDDQVFIIIHPDTSLSQSTLTASISVYAPKNDVVASAVTVVPTANSGMSRFLSHSYLLSAFTCFAGATLATM